MKELFLCGRAELVKMRHTFLYPLHILAAVCGSVFFLLYYRRAISGGWTQLSALAEVIGIALPLAVSLVCAGSVRLEEENHFQVFLSGTVRKHHAFQAKCMILWLLGAFTIAGAVLLFEAGSCIWLGREIVPVQDSIALVLILCLGSVPLYLEHLFFSLRLSGAVSMAVGTAQFILSALFLTGLGNGRWQFFPCTWSARGAALFSVSVKEGTGGALSFPRETGICLLITAVLYAIIRIWFYFREQ